MQNGCAKNFMLEDNTMTFLTVARQQIARQLAMQPRPKTINPQPAPLRLCRQGPLETLLLGLALSVLTLLAAPAILGGKNLPAQTHAPRTTRPAQQPKAAAKPAQPRRLAAAQAHAASTERQPTPEAIAAPPPASPAPIWPANQPPSQARVSWDGRGLEIEASNSSLRQILRQVAADTGAKLEGLTQDQRIFGSYGPGPGRDVLLKLLDGSGYNVLMIGGRDADAPLEIVLGARSQASRQIAANDRNRSDSEDSEPEPQPDDPPEPTSPPVQKQFATGNEGLSTDPQQFMQDILERQQKIDQQQQQPDQQDNPPQ